MNHYNSEKEYFDNLLEIKHKVNKDREDQFSLTENNVNLIKKKKNRENYTPDLFKEESFKFNLDLNDQEEAKAENENETEESNMINLFIKLEEPIKLDFMLLIHKNNKITLLKQSICDKLKEDNKFKKYKKFSVNSFILMKKYSILRELATITEANIQDKDIIYVLLKENFSESNESVKGAPSVSKHSASAKKKSKKHHSKSLEREESLVSSYRDFAPIEMIPILTKPGYKTEPDYKVICRMSLEELQNVRDFAIYNDYGRIEFPYVTNLESLNLDEIVNIEDKLISLYQINDEIKKHPKGEGLNKEAIIKLYNMKPTNKINKEKKDRDNEYRDFIRVLKTECEKKGMTFIKHDRESGEWTFKVDHF